MNQIVEVLNKCDVAYFDGTLLNWFFDEEENTIAFMMLLMIIYSLFLTRYNSLLITVYYVS